MTVFTIGFTQKNAEEFFESLKRDRVELVIDVRLNNRSQLAGFTKEGDIQYFLKYLGNIDYVHCENFAPTKELLSAYRKKEITWKEYEESFHKIMESREIDRYFMEHFIDKDRVCLLCSEPTAIHCHRRLIAEYLENKAHGNITVIHI